MKIIVVLVIIVGYCAWEGAKTPKCYTTDNAEAANLHYKNTITRYGCGAKTSFD